MNYERKNWYMFYEANVRVCFDFNFRIQLLFPFDSFDGYFPDCLTFPVVQRLE